MNGAVRLYHNSFSTWYHFHYQSVPITDRLSVQFGPFITAWYSQWWKVECHLRRGWQVSIYVRLGILKWKKDWNCNVDRMANHSRTMCGKGFIIDNIQLHKLETVAYFRKLFVPYLSVAIIGPLEIQPRCFRAANHGQHAVTWSLGNFAKMNDILSIR